MASLKYGIFVLLCLNILHHSAAQYPQKSESGKLIQGAIDLHMHTSPDIFERSVDDFQVAELAESMGLRALVIKNHVMGTYDRVELVNKKTDRLRLYGGITLNLAIGGINPLAVQAMIQTSPEFGKFVWFPTIDANHHIRQFGGPLRKSVSILDASGNLLPECIEVLDLILKGNLVLATGHLSFTEIHKLVSYAHGIGINKILINHPLIEAPGMTLSEIKQLVGMGAYIELTFLSYLSGPAAPYDFLKAGKHIPMEEMVELIRAVGADHMVLSSDLGQSGNPIPPDGFKVFVDLMLKHGITDTEIQKMISQNPAFLLNLDWPFE
jgi:hypothetical protein